MKGGGRRRNMGVGWDMEGGRSVGRSVGKGGGGGGELREEGGE